MPVKCIVYTQFMFFWGGRAVFSPCKAEQPLEGMELQKKNHKKIKAQRKFAYREPTIKRYLLILDLKLFRS